MTIAMTQPWDASVTQHVTSGEPRVLSTDELDLVSGSGIGSELAIYTLFGPVASAIAVSYEAGTTLASSSGSPGSGPTGGREPLTLGHRPNR
jgi:hypothetical protein